jgi:hypothetical protein
MNTMGYTHAANTLAHKEPVKSHYREGHG